MPSVDIEPISQVTITISRGATTEIIVIPQMKNFSLQEIFAEPPQYARGVLDRPRTEIMKLVFSGEPIKTENGIAYLVVKPEEM